MRNLEFTFLNAKPTPPILNTARVSITFHECSFLPVMSLPYTIPTPSCAPNEHTVPRSTYSKSVAA